MIFLETNSRIAGVDAYENVRQGLPVNFWPNDDALMSRNIAAIFEANPRNDIFVVLDAHLVERHFSQAIPPNNREPYVTAEQCAANYEAAVGGLGVTPHQDILRQLRTLRRGLDAKTVRWVYCRPESGLWYEGNDQQESERWREVRDKLVLRGLARADWGKAEWRRFTHKAHTNYVRQVLIFLGWLDPARDTDLDYWLSNAHGDEAGCHLDDWGNKIPAVELTGEQLSNVYIFPPDKADTQLARAVYAARVFGSRGVVHLRMCAFYDKDGRPVDVITPTEVVNRAKAIHRQTNICLFCGNSPDERMFGSPYSVGEAVRIFCEELQ